MCGNLAGKEWYGVRPDDQRCAPLQHFRGIASSDTPQPHPSKPPKKVGATASPSSSDNGIDKEYNNTYNLSKPQNMDRYPNCDNQVYDGYLLPNVPTCISSANSMAEDYLSAKYVKAFLKRGFVCMTLTTKAALSKTVMESLNKLLSTTTNEDTQDNHSLKDPLLSNLEPSPSLFFLLDEEGNRRYLGRGEIIYGKLVRDQERIRWGAQSKGGIDSKPSMRKHGWKLFRVFINHRLYKLDEESLIHFLGDTNCRSLLLIGSGGSPQKAGGSSHNIPSIHREERIIGSMSHDQRMNHMNQTMIEAAMNNQCISIWLGAETYNYLQMRKELASVNLPEMNDDDFYHLGYFEVGAYFSSQPKTLKELQKER
jgi:hypothetical protein